MKRLLFIGLLLAVAAAPCWGSGQDDFAAANSSLNSDNREDALALFQKAISSGDLTEAEMVEARYSSALLYFMSEKFEAAMRELEQVLDVQPDNVPAIGLRASIWVGVGNQSGLDTGANALADWERVLELDPADAITYNDRAMYYVETGDNGKAVDDLEKFLALEPDNPDHKYLLEQLKVSLAKQQDVVTAQ